MLVKDRKFLIGLKIFASIALCCTIVLWGALWIASATPGNESGQSTQIVSDKVDSIFNLSSKFNAKVVTQNVILNRPGNKIYFAGQQEQLTVSFLPKNTLDKDVYFVSDHPDYSTVDENGLVTFHSWGWSKIYVYLKSNPSIYNWVSVGCYGPNPDEVEPTIALPSSIKVGTTKGVRLSDNTLSPVSASYSSSDESVALASGGYVSGVSAGTATITATFESGKQISTQITVKENPDFIMPEKIVFKDNPTLVHGSEKAQSVYDLIDRVEPAGAPWDFVVTSSKKSVVNVSYNSFNVMGIKPVTLTYTSRYNPAVSASVTVNITKIPPTELRLAGADVITPHTSTQYSAKHMPQYYEKDVKWEVVSGNATITQNGVLVAKTYGKVVIRCTSTLDPTLSVEKNIDVKLFSNTYEMVRKFMGHGGLSALLGFGIFGTLFLLCKRKWGCALFSAPLAFVYAGISEGIQYFTPGRFCTITDVLIDFIGALIGMGVAIVLVALVLGIWRLASKKSFDTLAYAYKILDFKTLFKKTYKFDAPYRRELDTAECVDENVLQDVACDVN